MIKPPPAPTKQAIEVEDDVRTVGDVATVMAATLAKVVTMRW